MSDSDKQALLDGIATIQTKIEVLSSDGESTILTEENSVVSWDYEDFRYVKDEGWIGQFVAKQVNGVVKNISDDFSMTDKEFILYMGVKVGDTTTWYSLGNFLVNKVTDDEVNDKTSFEALDYTKKFNQTYVDSITYPCTTLELAQNVCKQCGCELGNTDFKHNDWEITGNVFTKGESCREVLKAIGKLAYSWVRIDWNNKVYIDFINEHEVSEYNKINNSKYYSLTTQKEKFGTVNRVVIGYKDIEGERTKVEDTESIEANGVNEITIFDNPLVYNQELREKAIVGAEDLFGLEYLPLETLTVGHPWLKGDELVEVTDMEDKVHKTIPFDRTIQYFGHIKTKISVGTNTKTNTEYAYESTINTKFKKTEIAVDKINGQITQVIEEQNETNEKLNEVVSTVDETKQTISKVETTVTDITTTTQMSTGGNSLYLEDALQSNTISYQIDGKCEQETRSGRNLFNLKDKYYVTNGITVDEDDWITISYDNTEGTTTKYFDYYTNNLDLKTDTDYNIVTEIKTVDGTGSLAIVSIDESQGQFAQDKSYKLAELENNTIKTAIRKTKSSFDGKIYGLRTFIAFYAGQSGSITFRISTLEDTTITEDNFEYEAYGASPSPDYPSEIKTIPSVRNLFDKNGTLTVGVIKTTTGVQDTNTNWKQTDFIEIKKDKYYIASCAISFQKDWFEISYYDENYNWLSSVQTNSSQAPSNARYMRLGIYVTRISIDNDVQLEEGSVAHGYVPYGSWVKVKITGKNLFKISSPLKYVNLNGVDITIADDGLITLNGTSTRNAWPDLVYGIQNNTVKHEKIFEQLPALNQGTLSMKVVSGTTDGECACYVGFNNQDESGDYNVLMVSPDILSTSSTKELYGINRAWIAINNGQIYNNFSFYLQLEEGPEATDIEPYKKNEVLINLQDNELCSIGDIKDTLELKDGTATLTKRIGKVVFDGSETGWRLQEAGDRRFDITTSNLGINPKDNNSVSENAILRKSTHFIHRRANINFKTWGYYYLYNGWLVLHDEDGMITDITEFQTWLSKNKPIFYYVLAEPYEVDLGEANIPLFEGTNTITFVEDLETTTSIKYYRNTPIAQDYVIQQQLAETNSNLSDTTDKTNQNTNDINTTNINLNNNYYTKNQINIMNSSTTQEITIIKQEVATKVTAEDLNIAIKEIKTTGVNSVTTETGYTFDKDGLKIKKSGSEMSSLLDNDGLVVKRDETEVLTVRSSGVETENLTVRTYFTIGDNTRVENYKGGTGFFYIGGDD